MTTVQASHGYSTSAHGDKIVFTYQHEKYKFKHLYPALLAISLIALISLMFIQPSSAESAFKTWLALTVGTFILILFLMNLNRKEGSFSISKDSIDVDGNKYSRKDITDLFYQQGKEEYIPSQSFHSTIIVGNSLGKSMMATGALNTAHGINHGVAVAGVKLRNNIAKLNCKIFIRYGNKNIKIAKGITADTSEVMMDKIVEVLQSTSK